MAVNISIIDLLDPSDVALVRSSKELPVSRWELTGELSPFIPKRGKRAVTGVKK
ncbi:MAG: hypothetical protein IPP31_09830 [Chitinophagaceae bacterium]|nr:hypothetical protein [Chitinophagaceae bacterium]